MSNNSDKAEQRFSITWRKGAYYVSIPEYQGGEVVFAEVHDKLKADLARSEKTVDVLESNARVQAKLLADTGRSLELAKKALEEALAFIDPDKDPPRKTNRELVSAIRAALDQIAH